MLLLFLLAALAAACSTKKNGMETLSGQPFGEAFTPGQVIKYDELRAKMGQQDSLETVLVGTVTEVCQAKGCWMSIASADANGEPMMVRFKDYGFFMPKDISGRKVVLKGYAFREVTSVDELRHYAEDANKTQAEIDAITEPKDELKFLASGVLLLDEKK
jgi:uncharacterized protein GlcG (DUF336 family)